MAACNASPPRRAVRKRANPCSPEQLIGLGTLAVDGDHPLPGTSMRTDAGIAAIPEPAHAELTADLGGGGMRTGGGVD